MVGTLRAAVGRFFAVDGMFLAAGLAFSFLVCLIPLVLLGVSVVGFVLSGERAAEDGVNPLARTLPVYRRESAGALLAIVAHRRISGILGNVILVFLSTQLFSASRLVMHRVLGARQPGGVLRNFARDALIVTLLSVFLVLGTVATWVVEWLRAFVLEPAHVSTQWIAAGWIVLSLGIWPFMLYLVEGHLPRRQ